MLWNRNQRNRNFFTSGTGTVTYKKSEPERTGTRYKIIAADPDCLTSFFLACACYESHYISATPSNPVQCLQLTAYLDRLVNWSKEFLGRRDNDLIYPVPIDRNVQAARGSSTTVDMNVDEENNKGGQPKH